jgi:hypothetical protein
MPDGALALVYQGILAGVESDTIQNHLAQAVVEKV